MKVFLHSEGAIMPLYLRPFQPSEDRARRSGKPGARVSQTLAGGVSGLHPVGCRFMTIDTVRPPADQRILGGLVGLPLLHLRGVA
jgi:hypothetical protein